jgi:hypothetical protein
MLTATSVVMVGMKYPAEEILEKEIKPILRDVCTSPELLGDAFEACLSELFSLKMKITYYQLLQEVNWKGTLGEVKERLPELRKRIEKRGELLLAESFAFALALSIEITNSVLETFQFEMLPKDNISMLLRMKFEDFINLIRLEALPQATQQNLIEITKTATFVDFGTLLTFLYAEEELEIAQSKVEELSLCLRDWAQLYGALAQELKIWRFGIPHEETGLELSEEEIEEERELADMGLGDYLTSILKDEEAV